MTPAEIKHRYPDQLRSLFADDAAADVLWENEEFFLALYEHYAFDTGEMPYGTAKARTGDPAEWMLHRITGPDRQKWEN